MARRHRWCSATLTEMDPERASARAGSAGAGKGEGGLEESEWLIGNLLGRRLQTTSEQIAQQQYKGLVPNCGKQRPDLLRNRKGNQRSGCRLGRGGTVRLPESDMKHHRVE